MNDKYPGLFSQFNFKGRGKAWLRLLSPEDRKAFAHIGLAALGRREFARLGGKARAGTALRDARGYFLPNPKRGSNE